MKKYVVEILETYIREIIVEADSEEKAIKQVQGDYNKEGIILDDSDFVGADVSIQRDYVEGEDD